jgi:hypothetical protein
MDVVSVGSMARSITIVHTPGCPNVAVMRQRLVQALASRAVPAPPVTIEEVDDPEDAVRRRFHGSPALLIDGVDAFAGPDSPIGFACRTYRTETGIDGAPSVDQIIAALTGGRH